MSGPLLDRIDLHVHVPPVGARSLLEDVRHGESSAEIRERVAITRERQATRYHSSVQTNAALTLAELKTHCPLAAEGSTLLERAANQLHLSARGVHRVLRVARTIADLSSEEAIAPPHLAEALQYRTPFAEL